MGEWRSELLLLLRRCSFPERRDRDVDWKGLKWGVGMGTVCRVQGDEKHGKSIQAQCHTEGSRSPGTQSQDLHLKSSNRGILTPLNPMSSRNQISHRVRKP